MMELFCEKYREKMPKEGAFCRRPGEYCKFRSACLIHFLGRENRHRDERSGGELPNKDKDKDKCQQ